MQKAAKGILDVCNASDFGQSKMQDFLNALSLGFADGETFPCFAQERVELEEKVTKKIVASMACAS